MALEQEHIHVTGGDNSGKQTLLLCCLPVMCTETQGNTTNSAFRLLLETLCSFSTQLPEQQREQGPAAAHTVPAAGTTVSCLGSAMRLVRSGQLCTISAQQGAS